MGMDSALQLFHFYPCDVELPTCPISPALASTSTPQVDIANILWAFAKLKVDEGERLRPLLQQAEEQLDSYLASMD